MSAAIFGLVGVLLGGLLSGLVNLGLEKRRERRAAQASSRLLEEELEPIPGALYRLRAGLRANQDDEVSFAIERLDKYSFTAWERERALLAGAFPAPDWYTVMEVARRPAAGEAPAGRRAGLDRAQQRNLGAVQLHDHRHGWKGPERSLVRGCQVVEVEDVRARCSRPGERLAPGGDEPLIGLVVDGREDTIRSARPVLVRRLEGNDRRRRVGQPLGRRVVDRYDVDPGEEARRMTLRADTPERPAASETSHPMVGNTRQRARATCAEPPRGKKKSAETTRPRACSERSGAAAASAFPSPARLTGPSFLNERTACCRPRVRAPRGPGSSPCSRLSRRAGPRRCAWSRQARPRRPWGPARGRGSARPFSAPRRRGSRWGGFALLNEGFDEDGALRDLEGPLRTSSRWPPAARSTS